MTDEVGQAKSAESARSGDTSRVLRSAEEGWRRVRDRQTYLDQALRMLAGVERRPEVIVEAARQFEAYAMGLDQA